MAGVGAISGAMAIMPAASLTAPAALSSASSTVSSGPAGAPDAFGVVHAQPAAPAAQQRLHDLVMGTMDLLVLSSLLALIDRDRQNNGGGVSDATAALAVNAYLTVAALDTSMTVGSAASGAAAGFSAMA